MVKTIFADTVVRTLCTYFERKVIPTPDAIDMWFSRVSKIPDEPVNWIVNRIKENSDTFPKNLPNVLWEYYREWMALYPEKVAHRHYEICHKCNGNGYIFALRFDDKGRHFQYAFRCPACDQAPELGIPFWSPQKHITDGFHPIPNQNRPLDKKTIREMLDSIGRPIR